MADHCPNCGRKVDGHFCSNCGNAMGMQGQMPRLQIPIQVPIQVQVENQSRRKGGHTLRNFALLCLIGVFLVPAFSHPSSADTLGFSSSTQINARASYTFIQLHCGVIYGSMMDNSSHVVRRVGFVCKDYSYFKTLPSLPMGL